MTNPLAEDQLSALLPLDETPEPGEHLDLPSLAAYLDRDLEAHELARVEEHLASCRSCRALATDAAGALAVAPAEPIPLPPRPAPNPASVPRFHSRTRTGRSRALAVAAMFFVALAAVWLLLQRPASFDHRLDALGVDATTFASAPTRVQSATLEVLEGTWPASETFAGLEEASPPSALRGADELAPRPIAPRWTVIRDRRPTLLWYPARPEGETKAREEIFLVDEMERVVAIFGSDSVTSGGSDAPRRAPFPADLPPLEPGALYAWKVNSQIDGERLASPFVPFRVLDASGAKQLDRDLASIADDPVLAGLLLAHRGLYAEAVTTLASVPVSGAGAEIRAQALRSCLERTIDDTILLDRELRRLTGANSP